MPSITEEITIATEPHSVFKALIEQEGIACWWTDDLNVKPEVGSLTEFRFRQGAFVIVLEVAELEQDRKVHWTLKRGAPSWVGTSVTWRLEPTDNGTRIHFSHDGFAQADEQFQAARRNWEHFLDSLKNYLETGKGSPGLPQTV